MMNHEIVANASTSSLVDGASTVRAYLSNAANMAAVLKRLAGTVYNVTYGTATPSMVADFVQDTLVKVLDGAAKYDASKGTVPGWISMVCRNLIIDAQRHSNYVELTVLDAPTVDKDGAAGESMLAGTADPGDAMAMFQAADYAAVAQAIGDLDGEEQEFLADILSGTGIGDAGAKFGWISMTSTRNYQKIIKFLQKACEV